MKLPAINLDLLRSIPLIQKVGLLLMVLAGIIVGFYYYVAEPKSAEIAGLQVAIGTLDSEIQTLTIKVKHLDELIAANKQLEIELAKKKEKLPPEEEAVMLLKQVSDLGIRLGLDVKAVETESQERGSIETLCADAGERRGLWRLPYRSLVFRSNQRVASDCDCVWPQDGISKV